MTLIKRTIQRTSQPQGAVGLATSAGWRMPLVAVLPRAGHAITIGGTAQNFERVTVANGSGIVYTPGVGGIGVGSNGSSTNVHRLHSVANRLDTAWDRPSSQATWLVLLVRYGNTGGNSPIFGQFDPNQGPYVGWGVSENGGSLNFEIGTAGGYNALSPGTLENNKLACLVGRYNGTTIHGFRDGARYASSAAASGNIVYPSTTSRGPSLGNFWNYTGQSRSFNGRIFLAALWDVALSDAEIAAISRNPWQLFAAQERSIWVPVTADTGSTGTSATTNANDTSSASGTTTIVGTSTTTNAADTSSASGTTTVVGTSATTNADDTSAASGEVGGEVTGTSTTTNAADTASAQGWAGVVSGTVAYTNNDDTASASGDAGPPDTRKGGHVYLRSNFVQARKRLHLQRLLDFLTEEEPQEETKRIIRAVKAGKPVEQDRKPPVVLKEVSAEKLASRIKPERVAQLPPDIDLQQVIRRAIELAQEQDDEDILLLL